MLKKCIMPVLNGLLIITTLFTFTCTLPLDPLKNPDVVDGNIFALDQEIIEGMPASFGISLTYPMHVCSVVVAFDENRGNDTSVYCKTKVVQPETLVVNFTYLKENASQIIKAIVMLSNGKFKNIELVFKVRKKNLEVSFVSSPKPHLSVVKEPDTLIFTAKNNSTGSGIIFNKSSVPVLDSGNFKLVNKKDTAILIVIPEEKNSYNIYCYAQYGDAFDTTDVTITAYEKPLLKASSGNETQITGTSDTLFLMVPASDSGFQFILLDSSSYDTSVLSTIPNVKDKKTYRFTPNEIKTYSFSFLVKKGDLTDTITYQRVVIENQKPVWNRESEKVTAVEGKVITFTFASCLTDTLKKIAFKASKGTIAGYSLSYLVPWGSGSTDTVTINADNNGVTSPFKLYLNIISSDSIAPKIIRVKPESDTINTDKLTCEFKILDLGAGVGEVTFERDSKVITDTAYSDSIYKCTINGLKHGDTIKLKVTATDKSMIKNSDSMLRTIVVIKSDTSKSITDFSFIKPLAEGVIDNNTKKISVTVPYGTDVHSLEAVFTTTGASVQINSKEQKSGITVNDFTNPVKYTVTAVDKSIAEYEVTVFVAAPGKNADLCSLSVSSGSLSPAFAANITNYTVNVANSVESLTVTGTLADTNATINYMPSQKVKISVGDTIITVNVTAQDSTVKKKYEIKVIRAASSNANLSSLTVNQGVLTPTFAPEITSYTVNVANSVEEITVTGTQADSNADISYTPAQKVKLFVGDTTINVIITAKDGTTKKKYEIKVIRSASSSKEITSFGFVNPAVSVKINANDTNISLTVPYGTKVNELIAKFETTGATVKIGPLKQESGKTVNDFSKLVTYTVYADDGSTRNYVVKVSNTPAYEYIVTFDGQEATTGPNPKTKIVKEPARTVDKLPDEPTKVNCKFEGWYTDKNGTGNRFTGATQVTQSMLVYAYWVRVYRVIYDGNTNTGGKAAVDTNSYKYGDPVITLSKGDLKKDNHTFIGWNSNKDGNGTQYKENDKLYMANGDITLYAQWKLNTYTVTFDADGGSPVPTPQQINHGSKVVKPADPDKPNENVKFIGWYNGNTIWKFDNEVNRNLTLTAHWEIAYKITYHGNYNSGGDAPIDNNKYLNGEKAKLKDKNTLTNIACEFEGWKKIQYGLDEVIRPDQEITITQNITLYAVWIVSDWEGNKYATVQIGDQLWMAENLRSTKYNNGDSIPYESKWEWLGTHGYCFPYNSSDPVYQAKWGALYNWYAVNTKKLAPEGWIVPSDGDWGKLENYLIENGYNYDGEKNGNNKIAKALAAKTDWNYSEATVTGSIGVEMHKNNKSGFSALPAGFRDKNGGFDEQKNYGNWWCETVSENDTISAWIRELYYDGSNLKRYDADKRLGFSVRLIRNY